MQITTIHKAKTHLSELIRKVEAGEDVVICKAGTPIARLIKYISSSSPRKAGAWKGKVKIAQDFDQLSPELLSAFHGNTK